MSEWMYMGDTLVQNGADAALCPQDRGFRFGDGVFETIAVFGAKPYQWAFHMQRLRQALAALHISPPPYDLQQQSKQLIAQNGLENGFVRIAISRGVGSQGYRPLASAKPTLIMECMPRGAAKESASLWCSTWRKPPLNCLPSNHKTAQGLNSTLALLQADANQCDEALLLAHDDTLCEAASGNLFWINGDAVCTPALASGCLNGSTRHALMRLHPVQEVAAPIEALQQAQAVFITNCNCGILPVSQLQPMGWQWRVTHPLLEQLKSAYMADIHASV